VPSRKAPVGLVFEQPLVYTAPKESTMRFYIFFIALIAVASAPQGALANPAAIVMVQNTNSSAVTNWPSSNATHRTIFCGAPDTETSLAYGAALNAALNDVIAASELITGKRASVPDAMNVLKARAQCPAGSHLPIKEVAK
jgi:hypothetical protein